MTNLIQFEGGDILASAEPLTVTGLLIPFNEVGRTNVGRFQVEAGSLSIPSDPAVVGLNLDHERSAVVGRAIKLEERPEGVFATLKFADTPEGRAAYADATSPTGKRRKLSGEFGPAVIKAGRLVAGHAKLWGAAVVEAGAFPSAQVLAADTPDDGAPPAEAPVEADPAHLALEAEALPDDITVTTPAGDSAVYTPEAAPAPANPEGEVTVTATAAGAQAPAIPQTVLASAPQAPAHVTDRTHALPPIGQVFAAIATLKSNPFHEEAQQVLAALTDITLTGNNALPGTDVLRPNWVGQLDQGNTYVREYIDLGTHGNDISAAGKKGFKVHRGTSGAPIAGPDGIPNGGTWAGNKTEINSYNGWSETVGSTLRRFAVGNDIAREFYDLPGGAEVVQSFLELINEDYLYWSDQWALYDINAVAGAPVAAATYPTDYPAAMGMLIQGILAIKARKSDKRRDVPTFAIANDIAYAQLAYAAGGAENLPEFVDFVITTASEGRVDKGAVQVVQGETGIYDSASVIVGAKKAIHFDELAGGPLHIDALELAKGGIDKAVHGYLQTFVARPEAFVRIGTADTGANSTAVVLGEIYSRSSVIYRVEVAGTTGSSAPTAPAVGATVADGTATVRRLK